MIGNSKDPFAEPRSVALYQDLSNGWIRISTYWGKDDSTAHCGDVRISEPLAVTFKPLSNKEAIGNAVAALDAQEKKVLADTEMSLWKIRQQKQNLLAITYQPDPPNTDRAEVRTRAEVFCAEVFCAVDYPGAGDYRK